MASIHPVVRARGGVFILLLVLCMWLLPGVNRLQHDDDVLAFLPPDHPDVQALHRVAARFGMLSVGLIGLAADGGSVFEQARTERVRKLARRLAELPGVTLVLSYPDLPDATVQDETLVVDLLVPTDLVEDHRIAERVLANPNAVGNLVSGDGRAAALLVYLASDPSGAERARRLAMLREETRLAWDGPVFFGGAPFIEDAAAAASREDIQRLSPVVIVVLTVVSAWLLRSLMGALLNLILTGLGVGLVTGAHSVFGEPFTIVSSTTPVLMVALGGAFGMHIIAGYQRQQGSPPERASAALRELWFPVVLSGCTTALAFFALWVMPQEPMQRFGVVAGLGVLLLLGLALGVLPGLLASLPARAIPLRGSEESRLRWVPPLWLMVLMAMLGAGAMTRWSADADTRNVFDPQSEPALADAFFADHFGGSQFVQIAIAADLSEPAVLRRIRTISDAVAAVGGVADVRSLLEPVALLNEGFGGRRGIPETPERARRVITNLADQAPMAQLMTPDGRNALVHVKLRHAEAGALQETVGDILERIRPWMTAPLHIGAATQSDVAGAQLDAVRDRLRTITMRELAGPELLALLRDAESVPPERLEALRDRALGTDELIEPLPPKVVEAVDPRAWSRLSEPQLRDHLRVALPQVQEADPEGIEILAAQVHGWMVEARDAARGLALCRAFGIEASTTRCKEIAATASELRDVEWETPPGAEATIVRELPWAVEVTGQPLVGQAFAQSVTRSLVLSTWVSLAVLTAFLAAVGHLRAVIPALWTLSVSGGILAMLGYPISVATSMVACVSLGAGVDFAIHLGVRAKACSGSGRAAVAALGGVVLMTGAELALAFLVLRASTMPPLRHFGVGLAVALACAAAGAVWLTPRLYRAPTRMDRM